MITKNTKRIYLIFLLCLFLIITPVLATVSVNGVLGGTNYASLNVGALSGTRNNYNITGIYVRNIENTGNLKTIVEWINSLGYEYVDAGAPSSAQTPITIRLSNSTCTLTYPYTPMLKTGQIIGTGTIGYQRSFNTAIPPVEQVYPYLYITLDSWNITGLSGTQFLYLDYNPKNIYNFSSLNTIDPATASINFAYPASCGGSGSTYFEPLGNALSYLNNKDYSIFGSYVASYPAQIGIGGAVIKTSGQSNAYVFNTSGQILTAENTVTSNEFDFTTLKQPIVIGIKSGAGVFYNSSVLFPELQTNPNPTPTVTSTATPNPYPNATVNGFFHFYDYSTNLDLSGVTGGYCAPSLNWCSDQAISDSGGVMEIDNLPVNIAGSFSASKTGYGSKTDERHYPIAGVTGFYNAVEYLTPIGQITPTITPTISVSLTPTVNPTQTITPIGNYPVTITVTDQFNSSLVSGVGINIKDTTNTSKSWINVTAYGGSITFSASYDPNANTQIIRGHLYTIALLKTGYVTQTTYNQLIQDASGYGFKLTPIAYNPTGGYINLLIQLWDTSNNQAISKPLTGSIKITNESSTWNNTYSNPQFGLADFNGITPSQGYKVDVNVDGYQSYTGEYSSSSSQAGTTQYFYANLIPSTILPSNYVLTVNPSSGTFNDTYNLVITGDLSNAKSVIFKFSSPVWNPTLLKVGNYYTSYQLISGVWKIWDGSAWQTSSLPQSINVKFPASNGNNDVYTIYAYITSTTDQSYTATAQLNIISAGKIPVSVTAYDMDNTLPTTGQLSNFDSHVYDIYQALWYNHTYTPSDFNNAYLYLNAGTEIYYYGSAQPMYADTALKYEYIGIGEQNKVEYDFMRNNNIFGDNNVTVMTHVTNIQGNPIVSAKVVYSDSQYCFTSDRGSCTIVGLNNTYYYATATAQGYQSGTAGILVSKLSSNNIIDIVLLTATPTTPIYTPSPTNTISPNITTPQSWTNENVTVCGGNTTNFIDYAKSLMACNGLTTGLSQSLALAAIIIIIFLVIGAWKGQAMGGGLGAIIGFVLSYALNLIPFMLLALIIVLLILVGAILLFSRPSGS